MDIQLMGILRTQKIIGQAAIRREHRGPNDNLQDDKINRSLFILNADKQDESIYKVQKEIRGEQVKDIMRCMSSHAISKIEKINEIVG